MAYRCPVCETPQVDALHLANHLAFTAVIRGDDHEAWLEEHAPDWNEENPETLAPKVAEAVPEVEVPELDDGDHDGRDHGGHGHGDHGGRLEDELARQGGHRGAGARAGRGDLTGDAADVLEEARELTRRKYEDEGAEENEGADRQSAEGDEATEVDGAVDSENESE